MKNIINKTRLIIYRLTKQKNGSGFSMLEAVVVVGVLLALAVGGLLAYGPITANAKKAAAKSAASSVYTSVLVSIADGDPTTNSQKVIDDYNSSQNEIRMEILEGAAPAAMATTGYVPKSDNDFCVRATVIANVSIFAEMGNCPTPTTPSSTSTATPTPVSTGATASPSPTATATSTPTPTPTPTVDPATTTAVTFTQKTAAPGPVFTTASDLRQQVASVSSAVAQVSTDSGTTWTPITNSMRNNVGGASPNGKYIVTGGNLANGGTTQSNISKDYGATWNSFAALGTSYVGAIAISNDGMKIMVAGGGGGGNSEIKVSHDGGASFTHPIYVSSSDVWSGMAGTDDLSTAYGVDKTAGTLKVTKNGGTSWTSSSFPGVSSVAVSSTGKNVVLGFTNATIRVSNDFGATFNAVAVGSATGVHNIDPRGISSDGQSIVISDATSVYLSRDAGVTWTKQTLPSAAYVARISGDGTKFLATTSTGARYTG